jgi:hypothetical protein
MYAKDIYIDDHNMPMYWNNYSDDCDTLIAMSMTVLVADSHVVNEHWLANSK